MNVNVNVNEYNDLNNCFDFIPLEIPNEKISFDFFTHVKKSNSPTISPTNSTTSRTNSTISPTNSTISTIEDAYNPMQQSFSPDSPVLYHNGFQENEYNKYLKRCKICGPVCLGWCKELESKNEEEEYDEHEEDEYEDNRDSDFKEDDGTNVDVFKISDSDTDH